MIPGNELVRFRGKVPYYSQLASEELAEAVFDLGMDPREDPRWEDYGADSAEEYAYWASRACGAACVKMVVEACGGPVRSMMEWIRIGQAWDSYRIVKNRKGEEEEIGWDHRALAKMIEAEGYWAEAKDLNTDDLVEELRKDKLIIASVSYELGTERKVTRRGGHLAVLCGVEAVGGKVKAYILHNPSGRTAELRRYARIPAERFEAGFARRGISVGRSTSGKNEPMEEAREGI